MPFSSREKMKNCWRARILPAEIVRSATACDLATRPGAPRVFSLFFDADIIEGNGDNVLLSFPLHPETRSKRRSFDWGDMPAGDGTQSAGGHVSAS